jgi:hypothetical protein
MIVIAKTSGAMDSFRKVIYTFVDSYPSVFVDKKDIISAQLDACERLLKNTNDRTDRLAIESEIMELQMALDLLP